MEETEETEGTEETLPLPVFWCKRSCELTGSEPLDCSVGVGGAWAMLPVDIIVNDVALPDQLRVLEARQRRWGPSGCMPEVARQSRLRLLSLTMGLATRPRASQRLTALATSDVRGGWDGGAGACVCPPPLPDQPGVAFFRACVQTLTAEHVRAAVARERQAEAVTFERRAELARRSCWTVFPINRKWGNETERGSAASTAPGSFTAPGSGVDASATAALKELPTVNRRPTAIVLAPNAVDALNATHTSLLEVIFAGCSQVDVTLMHGGFSGSLVVKTQSYDADGQKEEPTVTKIDTEEALREEYCRTCAINELVGEAATQVSREPVYEGGCGALVLEMAGACWVLPEFFGNNLIDTFQRRMVGQLVGASPPFEPRAENSGL